MIPIKRISIRNTNQNFNVNYNIFVFTILFINFNNVNVPQINSQITNTFDFCCFMVIMLMVFL